MIPAEGAPGAAYAFFPGPSPYPRWTDRSRRLAAAADRARQVAAPVPFTPYRSFAPTRGPTPGGGCSGSVPRRAD